MAAWWDGRVRAALVRRWRGSPAFQDRVYAAATFAAGLVLNLVGLTQVWTDPQMVTGPAWWHTAALAVGCLAMLGKRRRPVLALGIGTVAALADLALGGSIALVLVMFDLIFSVGLFAADRARTAVTTAVFVVIGTASVVGGLATGQVRVAVFVGLQLTTLLFVPLWWAANLRQQRRLGELGAREAVLAERAAMARDLHDVIAAHLSTTALHSGAALAAPPDTGRDRAALAAVRTSSLAALTEMRSMVLLLRAAEDLVMPGGLDRLPELVATAEAGGLTVQAQLAEIGEVPAVVAHAVYRIVREALTNAGRHAPAAHVRLDVSRAGDEVTVTVTNTLTRTGPDPGRPDPGMRDAVMPDAGMPDPAVVGAGIGLSSMRDRAALLGGQVTAGLDGDVWRVRATLPLRTEAS